MCPIIIFGLSSAGLFMLRELSNNENKIYSIGRKNDVGQYSKYGSKYIAQDENELKDVIYTIIKQNEKKPCGIIASAYYLTLILERFPELFELIDIDGPNIDIYKTFDNKIKTYSFLKEYNIPVPKSYFLEDINLIEEYEYPLILKWSSTELNSNKKIIRKTEIVYNKLELYDIVKETDKSNSKLILQNYIQGQEIDEYGYGGYFISGEEKMGIFIKVLRQYPMGIYTFAREVENEITKKIQNYILTMLKDINYCGFIQLDIKVNLSDYSYYVLDVNARPWNSIKILKKKYPEFYYLFNKDKANNISKKEGIVQWACIFEDLVSIINSAIKQKSILSFFKDLQEYFKYDLILDIIQIDDLKPIIGMFKLAINKMKRMILKR